MKVGIGSTIGTVAAMSAVVLGLSAIGLGIPAAFLISLVAGAAGSYLGGLYDARH